MEFQDINLSEDLKSALLEAGYITATEIQERVLEPGLAGRDIYAQSQTGTGKTAAYLLVIFQRLLNEESLKGKKALIMTPTRELAVQVEEEACLIAKHLPFKIASFYGGVGYGHQQKALRDGADILIGTPGRVLDLNSGGEMNLMEVAFLILDEADRMFDMGFFPDLRRLLKVVPASDKRQTMLFSATLNVYVKNLAIEYTNTPVEIEIEPEHITVEEIEQVLYHVPNDRKFELLLGIMEREKPESAIIFCNTKRWTEIVAKKLRANGIHCEFISGDLPQKARLEIINGLKSGKYHFLVATDLAARGLDIELLSMVVNYDLPVDAENYVHRIGRTARAGAAGKAVSFASERDVYEISGIEKFINAKIPAVVADDALYVEDKSRRPWGRGGRVSGERGERNRENEQRRDFRNRSDGRQSRDSADNRNENRGGESRGGEGRGGEARSSEGLGRFPKKRRSGQFEQRENGQRGQQHGKRERGQQERPNLSKMSDSEREEYYKQKYDAPRKEEGKPAEGETGAARKDFEKGRRNKEQWKKRRQQGAGGKGQKGGGQQAASGAGKEKVAQPKGLFSKLLGLFKKKD